MKKNGFLIMLSYFFSEVFLGCAVCFFGSVVLSQRDQTRVYEKNHSGQNGDLPFVSFNTS